jgi:YggT family protein
MISLGDFPKVIADLISLGLEIYMWLIIARVLLSWATPDPYNPIVRFLYKVTEPVLSYFRRQLPMFYGGLDFSPIAAIMTIVLLKVFLVGILYGYGAKAIIGRFLLVVAGMLDFVLIIFLLLIIARTVVSLVNADPYNPIVRFLYNITEPILSALRRRIPLIYSGFDFSPLVALGIIFLLRWFLIGTITGYATKLVHGYFG